MEIETFIYRITSVQYVKIIMHISAGRYKYLLIPILIISIAGSFIITDFVYAAIIIIFGIFPFLLFHAYFVRSGSYENSLVFAEKFITINKESLKIHLFEGGVISYDLQDIKYKMFTEGNYIFEIKEKILLNIPSKAFKSREDVREMLKIVSENESP
ncbi:MAG: hypothetical protein RR293_00370 [Bacteroidales bacterium]